MNKQGMGEVYRVKPPRGLDMAPFLKAEKETQEEKASMWRLGD